MSSLVVGLGGKPGVCAPMTQLDPGEVAAYRNVVLLVLDGLGYNHLLAQPGAQWLNSNLRARMTSVFPSTTATAVTTFLTGDAPQQHGLTGWHMYFRELGSVIAVLPGRARYGGVGLTEAGVSAASLFSHVPFYDRLAVESHVLSPAYIAHSDFNLAHLGRAQMRPFRGIDAMLSIAASLIREDDGRKFIYGYWPDLDSIGHAEGCGSPEASEHLSLIDESIACFADEIAGTDTLLLVTADHGQIDTTPADRINLDDHPYLADTLVLPLCGESRLAYCYVKSGRVRDFERYVTEELAHAADLLRSRDLIADGWFGPGEPHSRLAERVGDYTLVMKEHYVIKDWLPHEQPYVLVGVHGGVTADEMFVPLVVHSA